LTDLNISITALKCSDHITWRGWFVFY